jgi:glycerol-3-phosphate dehydrogenase
MAEDTVDAAALVAGLEEKPSPTVNLRLHGWLKGAAEAEGLLGLYGSDGPAVSRTLREAEAFGEPLDARLPYFAGEVAWAVRHEMARTVDDVLSRRTRALLLDARASVDAAPTVARLMAAELGRDEAWVERQVAAFRDLAANYILN